MKLIPYLDTPCIAMTVMASKVEEWHCSSETPSPTAYGLSFVTPIMRLCGLQLGPPKCHGYSATSPWALFITRPRIATGNLLSTSPAAWIP